jgi:hypothetical protein
MSSQAAAGLKSVRQQCDEQLATRERSIRDEMKAAHAAELASMQSEASSREGALYALLSAESSLAFHGMHKSSVEREAALRAAFQTLGSIIERYSFGDKILRRALAPQIQKFIKDILASRLPPAPTFSISSKHSALERVRLAKR